MPTCSVNLAGISEVQRSQFKVLDEAVSKAKVGEGGGGCSRSGRPDRKVHTHALPFEISIKCQIDKRCHFKKEHQSVSDTLIVSGPEFGWMALFKV